MSKYLAFLLRIWLSGSPERETWRASLEDPHTRHILAFDSVENLCVYLRALATLSEPDEPVPSKGDVDFPPP
ncbi:MAG: hypothetical protein ACOYYS_20375 [Chloroflexota bacterium]